MLNRQCRQAGRQRERTEAVRQKKGQRAEGQSRRDRVRNMDRERAKKSRVQHVENMLNTWSRQGREKEGEERAEIAEGRNRENGAEGREVSPAKGHDFFGFPHYTSDFFEERKAMK